MVGGVVVETIVLSDKGKVWVNCKDRNREEFCAIYVVDCRNARAIQPGDSFWWQGADAYWTPVNDEVFDIQISRIGFSGVSRPEIN